MAALPERAGIDSLTVELPVDGVRTRLLRMAPSPELPEANVVLAAAESARPVTRRECRCLVEEEELGEASGLQQRRTAPAAELEPAGDPAATCESPSNAALLVVEAAAVAVHETAARVGDELAERGHPVSARHRLNLQQIRL